MELDNTKPSNHKEIPGKLEAAEGIAKDLSSHGDRQRRSSRPVRKDDSGIGTDPSDDGGDQTDCAGKQMNNLEDQTHSPGRSVCPAENLTGSPKAERKSLALSDEHSAQPQAAEEEDVVLHVSSNSSQKEHDSELESSAERPEGSAAEKRPTDVEADSEGLPEEKKQKTDDREKQKRKRLLGLLEHTKRSAADDAQESADNGGGGSSSCLTTEDSDDDLSVRSDDTYHMSHDGEDEEDVADYDPTPQTPRPPYKWLVWRELMKREYGRRTSVNSFDPFRVDCYGSKRMVERLELMYKMKAHEGCVNALHFNSNGTRLASGSDDLCVVVWDWTISEPVLKYDSGHRSNVFQAKFMPMSGDCYIVSCARDGLVRLAELSTTGVCKTTRRLAQHRAAAHKLSIEPDSPHNVLSCGEDAYVFGIDLRENSPSKLVLVKEKDKKVPLYTIFINPRKTNEFAVGGRDHFVRVYDRRFTGSDSSIVKKYCPHHLVDSDIRASISCLVYNYDGTEILASYNDEDIYIFNTAHSDGAEFVHRYRGHRNSQTVKGVNYFGLRSEYVVSGSDCGYIYVWDKETEHIVHFMHGDEEGVVNCLEPHPTCPILATSGLDEDVKIWVPSCETPPDMSGLKKKICQNMKEREDERKREGRDTIDSQMLWYLMQQLHRSARRRAHRDGAEANTSSDSDGNSDDDDDDDMDTQPSVQCVQS